MMLKRWILVLGLLFPLLACAANTKIKPFSWRYGTGSNVDSFCTTKAEFYWQGKKVVGYPGGGCNAGILQSKLINKKYYWAGGGGLPTDGVPVPDKAVIEMVSFHDRKRYRIKVDLPIDLEQKMRQVYLVEGRYDRRNRLYFGLAPGGYFEVILTGGGLQLSPDLLLVRGIAEEVTDDWYDKKVPVARQYGMDDFDKKYGELFKQYPIPNTQFPMAWTGPRSWTLIAQHRPRRIPIRSIDLDCGLRGINEAVPKLVGPVSDLPS